MATLNDYMAETGDLPDSVILGHIVYFTITDDKTFPVTSQDLQAHFLQLGLNDTFVPAPNRPDNAFKNACSAAERDGRRAITLDTLGADGRPEKIKVLVREVPAGADRVVRQFTAERVNSRGKSALDYGRVGEAVFYFAPDDGGKRAANGHRVRVVMDNNIIPKDEQPLFAAIRDEVMRHYQHECKYLDDQKIRGMVRNYLKYLNAVELKPGVYFVHKSRRTELDRLRELVSRLNNTSHLHTLPLVDLPAQREEVIEKFQTEAEKTLEGLIQDIAEVRLSRKKVTPQIFDRFRSRYDEIAGKATEYTRVLGISQDRTGNALEVAMDSLAELQEAAASTAAGSAR